MTAMYVFQRITVQGTVSSQDHVRYVRKNMQLAYMDSNLRKNGWVTQDSGCGDNKQITTTYTDAQSFSFASSKLLKMLSVCYFQFYTQ